MTRLAHHLTDEGVKLTFGPYVHVVTESEARRLAWAILADLDPDEAQACGSPLPARPSRLTPSGRRAPGELRAAVISALSSGPRTAAEVGFAMGESSGTASARLVHLCDLGLVVRLTPGGGRGVRATYALSAEGRAWLA